jgi:hypothetical protein
VAEAEEILSARLPPSSTTRTLGPASCSSIRPAGSRGCWTTDSDSFVIHVVTSTLGLPCGRSGLRASPSRLLLDDIVKLGVVSKDTGRRVGHEQVGRDS